MKLPRSLGHLPRWQAVAITAFVIVLMVVSAWPLVWATPVYGHPAAAKPLATTPTGAFLTDTNHALPSLTPDLSAGQNLECLAAMGGDPFSLLGPGCTLIQLGLAAAATNAANGKIAAENLEITLANYLNITNAAGANINATFQELLSYYINRAEAIVPYFLNQTWSPLVSDEIAIDSGLVPAIEGIELAESQQLYQDWNATAIGWNLAFGPGGAWEPPSSSNFENARFCGNTTTDQPPFTGAIGCIASDLSGPGWQEAINVTQPFEVWGDTSGWSANSVYFNMMPGGTIFEANTDNLTGTWNVANYTVTDVTTGTSWPVPTLSFQDWSTGVYPIESRVQSVGQFDLLKLTCSGQCATPHDIELPYGPTNDVEVSGAFAFSNQTVYPFDAASATQVVNTMLEQPFIIPAAVSDAHYAVAPVPVLGIPTSSICVQDNAPTLNYECTGGLALLGGTSRGYTTTAGQALGGPMSLYGFPLTANGLLNNTMKLAYVYWAVMSAMTDHGAYAVPADCSIPTPSEAFPAATDYAQYGLNAYDIEAVYLSYIDSVARAFNESFTYGAGFCGDPDLGLSFNWNETINPYLRIEASVYLAEGGAALYPNGTIDPTAVYADYLTWPILKAGPVLLYPFEYQANIPVGVVYAVPINDPFAAVAINWSGNLYYGDNATNQSKAGIPTYLNLNGNGNYIQISGSMSSTPSGSAPALGDAIYISSCSLNGTAENPCDIAVTYFNNFTYGIVHFILPPKAVTIPGGPGGGLFASGGKACGTAGLTAFYDEWAGYIVSGVASVFIAGANAVNNIPAVGGGLAAFLTTLGCIIGWIVVIVLVCAIIWVAVKIVSLVRG